MKEYKLYACGSNGNYQLGLGHAEDLNILTVVPIDKNAKISKIASGGNHTFILFEDGQLWSTGANEYGQCGTLPSSNDLKHLKIFSQIPDIGTTRKWKNVACGWEYSIAIAGNENENVDENENEIFSCGLGGKGELGLGAKKIKSFSINDLESSKTASSSNSAKSSFKEVLLEDQDKKSIIVDLQASLNHVVMKLSDRSIYGWGYNKNSRLSSSLDKTVWQPTKLFSNNKTLTTDFKDNDQLRFALGRDFTVFYSSNAAHLCGITKKVQEDISKDYILGKTNIEKILSMWSSIHVLDQNGMLHSVGNNSHGQKLTGKLNIEVKDYLTGSEHGLILDNQNSVYAWGWGEHGNCGVQPTGKDEKDVVFGDLNKLFSSTEEQVYMISGGCATTFVATVKEVV